MHKSIKITGLLMMADGFLTAVLGRDYIKVWQSESLGENYNAIFQAYADLPDRTLRLTGFAVLMAGSALALMTGEEKVTKALKQREADGLVSKARKAVAQLVA